MYPLELAAQPGAYRVFAARRLDPKFAPLAEKVHRLYDYTCQFCGFQAQKHQEIVNVDQNYYHNKMKNLATACCFCTQCFFIDAIGITDYGGGTLIYLPEIGQANLNSFCHVIFCAITNNTAYKSSAQALYRNMKFRTQAVEKQFGEATSTPAVFGRLLVESSLPEEKTSLALKSIRLLPARRAFRDEIKDWAEAAIDSL